MSDVENTVHCQPFPFGRPEHYQNVSPHELTPSLAEEEARRAALLAQDKRMEEIRRKHFIEGDYWMQEVVRQLREEGEPLAIMTLINRVADDNKFPSHAAKVERRREVLKLISVMRRQGRLERWGRTHVTLPETDEKFQAWLASADIPLNLPDPNLW